MGQLSEPAPFASDDGSVPADVQDVLAARAAGRALFRDGEGSLPLNAPDKADGL